MKYTAPGLIVWLACVVGCAGADEPRMYAVESEDLQVRHLDDRVEYHGTVWVEDVAKKARRPVDTVVTVFPGKGPRYWEVDTFTYEVQRVKLQHDDAQRAMVVTVDNHAPVRINQGRDGKFRYGGKAFRDRTSGRRELGAAVADDLRARRIEDDSVIASFHASRRAALDVQKRGKLFFVPVFVDIYTNIQDSLNVGSYNGNDINGDDNEAF